MKLHIGLQFVYTLKDLLIAQHRYIINLIKKFDLQQSNHYFTSMEELAQLYARMDLELTNADVN